MIRCRQFSRRDQIRFSQVRCRNGLRMMLSLFATGVFAAGLLVTSLVPALAQAQNDPGNAVNQEGFGFEQQQQSIAQFASETEVLGSELAEALVPTALAPEEEIYYDHPDALVDWGHATSQGCGDCPPGWRIRFDAMILKNRANSGMTLSNAHSLGEFDFESGGRVSLVRRLDCLDAWEFVFTGPFEWTESGSIAGVGLDSRLSSATVNLSEFNNATFHSQSYRSRLQSAEVNRRWYGWDVISTLYGVRYIGVQEDYQFNSTGAGGVGVLTIETDNQMIGPQIGVEMLYPVGNWMTNLTVKGAIMGNSTDVGVLLSNAGTVEINSKGDNLEFAALIEIGYYFSYQITPRAKVRAGYEFLWLYGFAAVPEQLANPIDSGTGSSVGPVSDSIYHGASAGFEFVW
jgi:hypothetical protein